VVELRRMPVDLGEILEQAVEMSRPLIDARGHRLQVGAPPAGIVLEADPTRLVQVFGNLLANAAKFTNPGGCIAVDAWRDGRHAVIAVRDTGVGIEAGLLESIFELFVQGEASLDRTRGGLGIGLTVVRAIVEMHGGSVEARSAGPGLGSEFSVRMPLLGSGPVPAGEDEGENEGEGEGEHEAGTPIAPACALRVLVVDDNVDAAEGLAAVLAAWGHLTWVEHGADKALRVADSIRPQVALLDLGLPGMDGFELGRRLRALAGLEGLLIVAVTGYGQEEDRRRTREAGFDGHLTKPVDLDALRMLLTARAAVR
jgi:CheY-like chemotaxis protein